MIGFKYYLVTSQNACPEGSLLEEQVKKACRAGIKAVQYRDKDLPAKRRYQQALRLRTITSDYGAKLFINDRLDVALAVGADGIHCPERGLPPHTIRKRASHLIIGVSVHSLQSARAARRDGADFLLFGTVFSSNSKPGVIPQGLSALSEVCRQCEVPVFAIGGITPARAKQCLDAGAYGVAGISSILKADDPAQRVATYKQVLTNV